MYQIIAKQNTENRIKINTLPAKTSLHDVCCKLGMHVTIVRRHTNNIEIRYLLLVKKHNYYTCILFMISLIFCNMPLLM